MAGTFDAKWQILYVYWPDEYFPPVGVGEGENWGEKDIWGTLKSQKRV